jgi:hypothetical protein
MYNQARYWLGFLCQHMHIMAAPGQCAADLEGVALFRAVRVVALIEVEEQGQFGAGVRVRCCGMMTLRLTRVNYWFASCTKIRRRLVS